MLRLEKLEADPRMKDLQPGLKKLREGVKATLDKERA
jgi:hypothetical protein